MIKTIIFDLGGVVIALNFEGAIRRFEELGVKDAACFYSQTQIRLLWCGPCLQKRKGHKRCYPLGKDC